MLLLPELLLTKFLSVLLLTGFFCVLLLTGFLSVLLLAEFLPCSGWQVSPTGCALAFNIPLEALADRIPSLLLLALAA